MLSLVFEKGYVEEKVDFLVHFADLYFLIDLKVIFFVQDCKFAICYALDSGSTRIVVYQSEFTKAISCLEFGNLWHPLHFFIFFKMFKILDGSFRNIHMKHRIEAKICLLLDQLPFLFIILTAWSRRILFFHLQLFFILPMLLLLTSHEFFLSLDNTDIVDISFPIFQEHIILPFNSSVRNGVVWDQHSDNSFEHDVKFVA